MKDVKRYIELIVEPTFEDFKKNPASIRHAFLACVAIYHTIDRITYPKSSGNLRRRWRERCRGFLIVDMVTHHFKHVESDIEEGVRKNPPKGAIPLPYLIFGSPGSSEMELRNVFFLVQEAVIFVKSEAMSRASMATS